MQATDFLKNFFSSRLVMDTTSNIDFNHMKIPARHMGISRSKMPQIAGSDLGDFEDYLNDNSVYLRKKIQPTKNLTLCQQDFNKYKIIKLMRKMSTSGKLDPIIVSKDGYVLDGSHRFLAVHNTRDDATIPTLVANVNIRPLLDLAQDYPRATFRDVNDRGQ